MNRVGAVLLLIIIMAGSAAADPRPGDVYREYVVVMSGGKDWRVTQPDSKHRTALPNLPNSVLSINLDDLKDAVRAEALIDRWGGHPGTTGKRIRFNGNAWLALPELTTTPAGHEPQCYMSEDNPVIEVPLSHLRQGDNTLEGISGGQTCYDFGFGQWGWYGMILRVYYPSSKSHPSGKPHPSGKSHPSGKPHPVGRIVAPASGATLGENPVITVRASGPAAITRVDVLAHYEGYDENGDGVYRDWHHNYHYADLSGHIGTAMSAPFRVTWNTHWIPDQPAKSIRLLARIRDNNGLWFVTQVVERLSLKRPGVSVKLYKPMDVPERFWVRANRKASSKIHIPESDDLGRATEAIVHHRTWNGYHERYQLNEWSDEFGGADHNYAYTVRATPITALKNGDNVFRFTSTTEHHGPEFLWPGPAVTVRYGGGKSQPVAENDWLNPDYRYRVRLEVDQAGAGAQPGEVELDFTKLIREAGGGGAFDENFIRVVTMHEAGPMRTGIIPWQFERAADYDHLTRARGKLLLPGSAAGQYYDVYFGAAGGAAPLQTARPGISVEDGVMHEGQESLRIVSSSATYIYHKEGAGLASLIDREGRDWISYRQSKGLAGARSAGEFRGIPNLGEFGHPGYTGERGAITRVIASGPLKVSLLSERRDGKYAVRWDIYQRYARMTVLKQDKPYWFLYEGTPAGKLDLVSNFYVLPDGRRRLLTENWNADLQGPEWVYFGDTQSKRALFLINHQEDEANDQFWQMEGNMTVFGFGRQHRCCERYLTAAPARFTVGFSERAEFKEVKQEIESAYREPVARVGRPEQRRYTGPPKKGDKRR